MSLVLSLFPGIGLLDMMYDLKNDFKPKYYWVDLEGPVLETQVGRWVSFSFFRPEDLPQVPACYVITVENHWAGYIGQTVNLRTRFRAHGIRRAYDPRTGYDCWVTPWGCFTKSMIRFKRRISEKHGDWLMHEARLIRRLQPLWNFKPKGGR